MANKPRDYIGRAQLSIFVAQKWEQNYPSYQVNFINREDFATKGQHFYAAINQNAQQNVLKKANTEQLKKINADIRKNLVRLKEYIRDVYPTELDTAYSDYGFGQFYRQRDFPRDNDLLTQRLAILLSKLQETGNPIAHRNKGLLFWQDLIARHATEWETCKHLKAEKARSSRTCRELHQQVGELLSKLYRQIAIDFPKGQIASVRRSFGFLRETY